jgi:hypothetical protein
LINTEKEEKGRIQNQNKKFSTEREAFGKR